MQQQQPSPEENRNLILAIALSFGVLVIWQVLFPPPEPPEQPQQQVENVEVPSEGGRPAPGAEIYEHDAALALSPRIEIDTPRLRGSLALKGAVIDELLLRDYDVTLKSADQVELLHPRRTENAYFAQFGWRARGGIVTPGPQTEWLLAPGSSPRLTPESPIKLTWDNGQGLVFERTISVDDRYLFTVTQTVKNNSDQSVDVASYGRIERHGTPETQGFWVLHEGVIGVINGSLKVIDYSDLDDADPIDFGDSLTSEWRGEREQTDQIGWLGVTDPYWLTALIPADGRSFRTMAARTDSPLGRPLYAVQTRNEAMKVAPGGEAQTTTYFFAGAKEVAALRDYQYKFDGETAPASVLGKLNDFFFYSGASRFVDAIDWGWFFFLTKPIFELLAALNQAIGNMGVAIILLTVLFKVILFPLAYKSYVSMSKMKKLQPEMKKIQERAGDDRMKVQQEMMALYKKEGVNPAAGCLPILAQIPIFFSLYKVLVVSLELRHAPFFAWVQDLSAPDPTSILNLFGLLPWDTPGADSFFVIFSIGVWPVLMGLSMWIQQQLNPAPTDPTQAQIFNMLPILFTFMLGTFASGLVIYWTANNVLTIIQQYTIMRSQGVEVELVSNIKRKLGLIPKESEG